MCQQAEENIFRAAILCACGQKLSARHIFYVAPFRSIIGQNVQEFKKALGGSEYLLEHHTDAVLDTENPEILRQLERWPGSAGDMYNYGTDAANPVLQQAAECAPHGSTGKFYLGV